MTMSATHCAIWHFILTTWKDKYMNKGEVYYVCRDAVDSVSKYTIEPGRPAIVVSSATVNATKNTVSVVYLTSKPKMDCPTHFITHCQNVSGTALCEDVMTVDKANIGKFIGKLSDYEIEKLNNCLRATFDLDNAVPYASNEDLAEANAKIAQLEKVIAAYKTILSGGV